MFMKIRARKVIAYSTTIVVMAMTRGNGIVTALDMLLRGGL